MINERINPNITSAAASNLKRTSVFFRRLVPASQWGMRSAAKWEAIAVGMAIYGFVTNAAIEAPINAWEVAVMIPVKKPCYAWRIWFPN